MGKKVPQKQKQKQKSYGGLAWLRRLITNAVIIFILYVAVDYSINLKKTGSSDLVYKGSPLEKLQELIQTGGNSTSEQKK